MSVVSVRARSFILALFIRDDGERFLLGDEGFDFKDSQLHFSANTIENDEVAKQGVDGVMLAGQVRRASVQSFDGYVGDATTLKEEVEQMRRDFIAFFAKGHHFRVIYIDCNRNAWQRKGGYLVDAPEVKELWQIHPEYHVGLNFEDVNYYEYDENAEGEEILSNIISVPISSDVEGGLVWDENGAVSEPAEIEYDTETATTSGTNISISDAAEAPLSDFKLKGNTSQQTYSGKNLLTATNTGTQTKNGVTITFDGSSFTLNGTATANIDLYIHGATWGDKTKFVALSAGTYTASIRKADMTLGADFGFKVYNNGSRIFDFNGNNGQNTTTLSSDAGFTIFYISITNGKSFNNEKFYFQLEKSSSATDYEPYVGGTSSPNPDYPQAVRVVTGENTVKICGKNLCDYTDAAYPVSKNGVVATLNSDGSITVTGVPTSSYIRIVDLYMSNELEDGATYTLSSDNYSADFYLDVAATRVGGGTAYPANTRNGSASFTVDKSAYSQYRISILTYTISSWGTASKTITRKFQIEKSSQATDFEPYQEQSYPISFGSIELCKIGDYQDSIYKSGGKWYLYKECGKVVLDESETYTSLSDGPNGIKRFRFTHPSIQNIPNSSLGVICDLWRGVASGEGASAAQPNTIAVWSAQNMFSITTDSTTYTTADFETLLTTSPATVYYALATPTDTEITNEALVAQLEAILSQGQTYDGANNITTVIATGNEQGELEITYYTKYDAKVVSGGYVWEAGGSGGPTIVTNESISAVSPVWTVFGPALNPMLENTTTGEQIQYVGMIGEGQTLVVDMGEQTARLDGLNVISNIVGEYLTLAPGSNTLLFSAEGDAPASEIGWSEIVG